MHTYHSTCDSARLITGSRDHRRPLTSPAAPPAPIATHVWRRLCDLSWWALKETWLRLQPILPGVPTEYWEATRAR